MTFTRSTTFTLTAITVALLTSTASMAQVVVAAPAPAATALEVAYNVGLVSDYRYRGISQTRLQPAVQGGVDLTYGAWYAGAWASNVKWVKDSGGNANAEIDLYGGYKYAVNDDVTVDVGVLAYQYPRNQLPTSANTTEVYVGVATGPFSAKYSRATSNLFGFASSKGSDYLEANVDYELLKGTNLVAHVGRQNVKNNIGSSYTDYKLGVTYEALGGKFAASVIGANQDYFAPNGKNISKAGLVVGYTKTF
jgi:uncharacterized protein (TIGR02001 family)